jgi:hypothetical protein
MSELSASEPAWLTRFLDTAYPRIVKLAVALAVIAAAASPFMVDWRGTVALVVGAAVGTLNLVWLHRGADLMVRRMLHQSQGGPSKLRVMLFFPLRYIVVIAAVYAILKSYPGVLVSFIVGLALPVFALIGESIYEAVVLSKTARS